MSEFGELKTNKDLPTRLRLLTGLKREITVDDSRVIPFVSKDMEALGYGSLGSKIGEGGEWSVRNLGDEKVAKIGEPDEASLIKGFNDWANYALQIVRGRLPRYLPETEVYSVDLPNNKACTVVVMDKVIGKELSKVKDVELSLIRESLLEILTANKEIYDQYGVCIDVSAPEQASRISESFNIRRIKRIFEAADPRHSDNLMATVDEEGQLDGNVMIIDPIMGPNKYDPNKLPRSFRIYPLLYKIATPIVFRAQQRLIDQLRALS